MQEIVPGLFLGDATDACNIKEEAPHIKSIINASRDASLCVHAADPAYSYLHIPVSDTSKALIMQAFPRTCEFIDNALRAGEPVLVHCRVGRSRSPTIVAAYLVRKLKFSAENALNHIRSIRPIVAPNDGFKKQLRAWARGATPSMRVLGVRRVEAVELGKRKTIFARSPSKNDAETGHDIQGQARTWPTAGPKYLVW